MTAQTVRRFALVGVAIGISIAIYLIAASRELPPEKARRFANEELSYVARQLGLDQRALVGPIAVRKSKKDYYFTWALRDHSDRAAIIIWVSNTGDSDATIVDSELARTTLRRVNR
jgi:hypothetical protein